MRAPWACNSRAMPVAMLHLFATPVTSAVFPSNNATRSSYETSPPGTPSLWLQRYVAVLALGPLDALIGEHRERARNGPAACAAPR